MSRPSPAAVLLRAARSDDAFAVAAIWHDGWRDGHLESASAELIAARDLTSFRRRASERVPDTTVAEIGGGVAGFVMVVDDEVEQVYVAATHRGGGVADALMLEAERRVADAGYRVAWLAVVEANARARRFYERQGWSNEGSFEYVAAGEGRDIPVPALRYVKNVGTSRRTV